LPEREQPEPIRRTVEIPNETVRKGTDAFSVPAPQVTSMSPQEIAATTGAASPTVAAPATQAQPSSPPDAPVE
jgi:hypothetical protein